MVGAARDSGDDDESATDLNSKWNPFVDEYIALFNNYYLRWLQLRAAAPGRVVLVKYEDVLQDCEAVLSSIRTAANISSDVIRLSFCDSRRSSPSYGGGDLRTRIMMRTSNRGGGDRGGGGGGGGGYDLWDRKKQHYLDNAFLERLWAEDVVAINSKVHADVLNAFAYAPLAAIAH